MAELRLLSVLGGDRPNSLFFAGDLGQRIFQTPFSWRSLGVDVRGRSQILRVKLPDIAPDPTAGRPAPAERACRCGRRHRATRRYDLSIQWTRAGREGTRVRGGRIGLCCGVAASTPAGGIRAARNWSVSSGPSPSWKRAIKGIEDAGLSAVHLSTHPGGVSGSVAVGNHAPRQGPGVPGRRRRGL